MTDTITSATAELRQQHLQTWLEQTFAQHYIEIFSLPGDASFRRYHRLTLIPKESTNSESMTDNQGTAQVNDPNGASQLHYIVMDAPPAQESIAEFVKVDELLSDCINVPSIIAKEMSQGFLVLQDFGTTEFAHLVANTDKNTVDSYYKQAIDTLLQLQTLSTEQAKSLAALPEYNAEMLEREMNLFTEWFLPYIGIELDDAAASVWLALQQAITAQVGKQAQVVVHRDYHSRNLMQDQADLSRLGVIDFQDAVIGAYSYDLVSLLRDAYVHWSEEQISQWMEYYRQALQQQNIDSQLTTLTPAQLSEDMNVMGVQRHLKILGIFVRLSERDGKTRYLADIPKVMNDLKIELEWLSTYAQPPLNHNIIDFKNWLEAVVLPAYQRRFDQV